MEEQFRSQGWETDVKEDAGVTAILLSKGDRTATVMILEDGGSTAVDVIVDPSG